MSERVASGGELSNLRRRDGQQWILDWVIKQAGREQNFEYDGRRVPPRVKSHAMYPTVMYEDGAHRERIAREAEERGHRETARDLYFRAVEAYHVGQHAISEDDNDDKIFLYERLRDCYDRVIALSSYRIERVSIPWEDRQISGILHLASTTEARPTVLYLPGMDQVKEMFPAPSDNVFRERGMNVLSIDGPGQGQSNLDKIRVSSDNYERAASAAIDLLEQRDEVLHGAIGVAGISMGSYWAMRLAATDARVAAVASGAACYARKYHIFERSSPRFKQQFMYMAGIRDEAAFDAMAAQMHLEAHVGEVACPCLMIAGEYDPLSPLKETCQIFDALKVPKELLVLQDDFHGSGRWGGGLKNLGGTSVFAYLADWLRGVLTGDLSLPSERKVLVPVGSGSGAYSSEVADFSLRSRHGTSLHDPGTQ